MRGLVSIVVMSLLVGSVQQQQCADCISSGKTWCGQTQTCGSTANCGNCATNATVGLCPTANCGSLLNCQQCLSNEACGWCSTTSTCVAIDPDNLLPCNDSCTNDCLANPYTMGAVDCPAVVDCAALLECRLCTENNCRWCPSTKSCYMEVDPSGLQLGQCTDCQGCSLVDAAQCPAAPDCSAFTDCAACSAGGCGWCQSTQQCSTPVLDLVTSDYVPCDATCALGCYFVGTCDSCGCYNASCAECTAAAGCYYCAGAIVDIGASIRPNQCLSTATIGTAKCSRGYESGQCPACAAASQSCDTCLQASPGSCGWCANATAAICVDGSVDGPYGTACATWIYDTAVSDAISVCALPNANRQTCINDGAVDGLHCRQDDNGEYAYVYACEGTCGPPIPFDSSGDTVFWALFVTLILVAIAAGSCYYMRGKRRRAREGSNDASNYVAFERLRVDSRAPPPLTGDTRDSLHSL